MGLTEVEEALIEVVAVPGHIIQVQTNQLSSQQNQAKTRKQVHSRGKSKPEHCHLPASQQSTLQIALQQPALLEVPPITA